MKIYFCKSISKPIALFFLLISFFSPKGELLNAEYLYEELHNESSTKSDEDKPVIPTNPFEIVEMIRKFNSLNDATNPSDAIDDAIKSFNEMQEK